MTTTEHSADEAGQPSTGSRDALKALAANRDYRRMWLGDTVSQAGSSASMLAYPLLTLAETGSVLDAGLIAGVTFFARLIGQVPAGYLADTVSRRKLLIITGIVHGLLLAAIAVMAVTGTYQFALMVVLTAAGSITSAFGAPARTQALRTLVERKQLAEAIAVTTGRGYALDLVMPVVGGALFALHRAIPFAVDAVTFWFSAFCVSRIKTDLGPEPGRPRTRFLPEFVRGWSLLWRDSFLRSACLYSTGSNLIVSAVLFSVILGNGAGSISALSSGGAITAAAVAGLVGAGFSPRIQRRFPLQRVLVGVCLTRAVLVLATATVDHPAARIAALVVVTFCTPITAGAMMTAQLLRVDREVLGRVSSAQGLIGSCAQPLAPLLAGALIHFAGPAGTCAILGAGFAVLAAGAALSRGLRVWAAA
ncbi:MFS transporter [Kribbella sp. DT2]|uniref:MFS transporter n=1 Tax=Kribbella sp. DT2 TaxID=3393427 RepID=UPI003CFAC982